MPARRILPLILLIALLLPCLALAENDGYGVITPAENMFQPEASGTDTPSSSAQGADIQPFAPETLEKKVIGADNRTVITSPSTYPYSAIAYMEMEFSCGCEATGSGFMVSKNCLMTAAHCLVCQDHEGTVSGITMYFGFKSKKNYLLRYNDAATYWYSNSYHPSRNFYDSDWDYAYIQLRKDVGNTTGWFGMTSLSDASAATAFMEVSGYRLGKIQTSYGTMSVLNDKRFYHYADTEPGYSGCPVFNSDYYVVAINIAHSLYYEENIARRITRELIDDMRGNGMFD